MKNKLWKNEFFVLRCHKKKKYPVGSKKDLFICSESVTEFSNNFYMENLLTYSSAETMTVYYFLRTKVGSD